MTDLLLCWWASIFNASVAATLDLHFRHPLTLTLITTHTYVAVAVAVFLLLHGLVFQLGPRNRLEWVEADGVSHHQQLVDLLERVPRYRRRGARRLLVVTAVAAATAVSSAGGAVVVKKERAEAKRPRPRWASGTCCSATESAPLVEILLCVHCFWVYYGYYFVDAIVVVVGGGNSFVVMVVLVVAVVVAVITIGRRRRRRSSNIGSSGVLEHDLAMGRPRMMSTIIVPVTTGR